MADVLEWKGGEGYDIHVLRGGPTSKALDSSLMLDTTPTALSPKFTAHFRGAPSNLGVDVNTATGEVTAAIQPAEPPKFPNFNFLMTATQVVGGVRTLETKIRIHVHESIEKVWLTPATLTIHAGSPECRFTVLALFDDRTVGDITDWTQLTYQSADTNIAKVLGPTVATEERAATTAGVLAAGQGEGDSTDVTVRLKLTTPAIDKSAKAKVFKAPTWAEVGQKAEVKFVTGPTTPKVDDLDPAHPDSVPAVVEGKRNILFVAEGFPAGMRSHFNKIVKTIVETKLLKSKNLQPFRLLKDAINYWSVFVESRQEGVSVLNDHELLGNAPDRVAFQIPLARAPQPTDNFWTVLHLMHEGGLPLPAEPSAHTPQAWVARRKLIYDLPAQAPVNPTIEPADVGEWDDLKSRTLFNERDTAFGMAHYDRPRASGQERIEGRLMPDIRRTSGLGIETFIANLKFGEDPSTAVRYAIGETWLDDTGGLGPGKDFGLVCFICQSGTRGASWKRAVTQRLARSMVFCAVGIGAGDRVIGKAATHGMDVQPPPKMKIPAAVLASQVAYGLGGSFDLQDEDGDGEQVAPGPFTHVFGLNLLPDSLMSSTTAGARTLNVRRMSWLWPRIRNAGLVEVQLDPNGNVTSPAKCDQNGNLSPTGAFLLVRLGPKPAVPFTLGDAVRLRAAVVASGSMRIYQPPSSDPIASFPLSVEKILANGDLVLKPGTPPTQQLGYLPVTAGSVLDPSMFAQVTQCHVIQPRMSAGAESTVVAEPIFLWMDQTSSPLNAPNGASRALCTPANSRVGDVTPTNLPFPLGLPKTLPTKADIVGVYDGGGGFDCGVFRPAGRCRMRRGYNATTPFCHVCRYVIVDKVDPTKHRELDDRYDLQYPQP